MRLSRCATGNLIGRFPNGPDDIPAREMRFASDHYDFVISLLIIPDWKPWEAAKHEG